jgi:hypothetical protein
MRALQILIAVDQLANALLAGMADETLSARTWRNRDSGKRRWRFALVVINTLFGDDDHCRDAFEAERTRRQLPPEYRT